MFPLDQSLFSNWNLLLQKFINSLRKDGEKVELHFSQNVGGNLLSVFAAASFRARISHEEPFILELSRSKTTIKAGLCYRFQITSATGSPSFSVAVSGVHASADQEGDATEQRIVDLNRITALTFEKSGDFAAHDLCLIGGDFNFRVNMERSAILDFVNQKNYSSILESDQQTVAKKEGKMLTNYSERPINFAPTYKYKLGTQEYNTSEPAHKRNPAYTDRIIYKERVPDSVAWRAYGAGSLTLSDHKPVFLIGSIRI